MSKWKAFYRRHASGDKECLGTFNSDQLAAEACDRKLSGDRNHECIKSLLQRHFYMVGYGPAACFIEETD